MVGAALSGATASLEAGETMALTACPRCGSRLWENHYQELACSVASCAWTSSRKVARGLLADGQAEALEPNRRAKSKGEK